MSRKPLSAAQVGHTVNDRDPVLQRDDTHVVQRMIEGFRAGESGAAAELWERYFARLVALARKRLRYARQLQGYEEDAALSAFKSFYRRARQGNFADLASHEDLWRQLAALTHQKVVDLKRREMAAKRGRGEVVRESEWGEDEGFADLPGPDMDPCLLAVVSEECRRRLESLGDPILAEIALLRMSLYTNEEIARQFGRSLSWVNRHIKLIKQAWDGG